MNPFNVAPRLLLWRVFLGIAVTLLVGLVAVAVLYRHELKQTASQALEIAGYKQTIGEQAGEIEGLRADIEKERRIAADHRADAEIRARRAAELERQISQLLEENDEARDWWLARMPAPLFDRVRPGAGGQDQGPQGLPAAGVPGADADAADPGRHQWFFVPSGGGTRSGD